jgi:hypothetical protein
MSYNPPPQGGYPGGYGGWGGPSGPPPGSFQKPSNGVLILVLGILSVATGCFLLAPVAWVTGNQSMREIRSGIMDPREEGMVQAGRIIGMIVSILAIAGIAVYCAFFALVIGLGAAGAAR